MSTMASAAPNPSQCKARPSLPSVPVSYFDTGQSRLPTELSSAQLLNSSIRRRSLSATGHKRTSLAAPNAKRPPDRSGGLLVRIAADRSADDFFGLEEVVDLDLGVLVAVRTVDRVGLDALGESLADRAFGGVGGVGRAHHFAVALHRVVALEHLHDDRAAGHEADEIAEERALLVDGVEAFRLLAGHLDALRGDDAQAGVFQHLGD